MQKYAHKYTSRDSKTPMFFAFLYQNYLIFLFSLVDFMTSVCFLNILTSNIIISTNISKSCKI